MGEVPLEEGQILTGPLFSEPMRVESRRSLFGLWRRLRRLLSGVRSLKVVCSWQLSRHNKTQADIQFLMSATEGIADALAGPSSSRLLATS